MTCRVEFEFVFHPLAVTFAFEFIVETAQSVDVYAPLSRSLEFRQRCGPVFEPGQTGLLKERPKLRL